VLVTLDLSIERLSQVQDYVRRSNTNLLRIIHVMYDDLSDHYITLVETDPKHASFLYLF